jgi:hypothetical protein
MCLLHQVEAIECFDYLVLWLVQKITLSKNTNALLDSHWGHAEKLSQTSHAVLFKKYVSVSHLVHQKLPNTSSALFSFVYLDSPSVLLVLE